MQNLQNIYVLQILHFSIHNVVKSAENELSLEKHTFCPKFEGKFKAYDEAKQTVTVMKGHKKLSFPLDKLSGTDQQWVKEEVARQAIANQPTVQEQLAEQAVGKNLKPGVLERLEGSRFARAELSKAPEYYLLYFSVSW